MAANTPAWKQKQLDLQKEAHEKDMAALRAKQEKIKSLETSNQSSEQRKKVEQDQKELQEKIRNLELKNKQKMDDIKAQQQEKQRQRAEQDAKDNEEVRKRTENDWYNKTPAEAAADARKRASEEAMKNGLACVICGVLLRDSGPFVRRDGKAYHKACMKCDSCGKNLTPGTLTIQDGKCLGVCCSGVRATAQTSSANVGQVNVGGTAEAQFGGMGGKFCSECGAQRTSATSKFCASCGAPF